MRILTLLVVLVGCKEEIPAGQAPVADPSQVTSSGETSGEDRFAITARGPVDLLFAVDGGDTAAASAWVESLPAVLDELEASGVDYHLGLVPTDAGPANPVVVWVDSGTVDPLGVLGAVPANGGGENQWMVVVPQALEDVAFLRPDSALTVVVVGTGDASDSALITVPEFVAWFTAGRTTPSALWCAVGEETSGTCEAAATAIGGGTVPVAAPALVTVVGDATEPVLRREFALSALPDPATIEVTVDTDSGDLSFGPDDWAYSDVTNSVAFLEYIPEPDSIVSVRYDQR